MRPGAHGAHQQVHLGGVQVRGVQRGARLQDRFEDHERDGGR